MAAKNRRPTFWTAAKVRRFNRLVVRNRLVCTIPEAAQKLGCSMATIHTRLELFGIMRNGNSFWTVANQAKLEALLDRNNRLTVSKREAARILGCSISTLRKSARPANIAVMGEQRPVWTPKARKLLATLVADNRLTCPVKVAAASIGCHRNSLLAYMRKHGIRPYQIHSFAWSREAAARLNALLDRRGRLTCTRTAAARAVGCDPSTISRRLDNLAKARA